MVYGALLAVFALLLPISWLTAPTAPWYAYASLMIIAVVGMAVLFPAGLRTYRQGRLPVLAQEVIRRKEAHRRILQEEAKGLRPFHYGLGWKIGSTVLCLFFLLLASSAWYSYAATRNPAILVVAVVHSFFALLICLIAFVSFIGARAYQRERVRDLRQLLLEEEHSTTSDAEGT